MEQEIVARANIPFYAISAGALKGRGPLAALGSVARLLRGIWQARWVIKEFAPDVILGTGGYVSVPLILAAWMAGCPSLIYLPDMEPGLAVKFLSRLATKVAVSFERVGDYFAPHKVVVSGYPVRRELYRLTREEARQALGLPSDQVVLLVLGGSRGAHSINMAVRDALEPLLQMAHVLHITGTVDYDSLVARRDLLLPEWRARYHLWPYLHEQMTAALVAADLAVARAGAATLGEFPAVGLPAILVPYPYAGQHQQLNAEFLAAKGGAVIIRDADLRQELLPAVRHLLGDSERLRAMRAAMTALARPQAAEVIARQLIALAREH